MTHAPAAHAAAEDASSGVLRDSRVRAVPWRDLVSLHRAEQLRELLLPLPWLLLAIVAAHYGFTSSRWPGRSTSSSRAFGWCTTPSTAISASRSWPTICCSRR